VSHDGGHLGPELLGDLVEPGRAAAVLGRVVEVGGRDLRIGTAGPGDEVGDLLQVAVEVGLLGALCV